MVGLSVLGSRMLLETSLMTFSRSMLIEVLSVR